MLCTSWSLFYHYYFVSKFNNEGLTYIRFLVLLQVPINLRNILSSLSLKYYLLSSVQFSHSVVSDSLWPHELQYARVPCSSPTPGVYSNPCPLNQWCHPVISSSVFPFSSCPQSLPASRSFPMSELFTWGGQSTGVSASIHIFEVSVISDSAL